MNVGRRNLFIPAVDAHVYVAPTTIVHYIVDHDYHPPEVFQKAVLECPTMDSTDYRRALKSRGINLWSWLTFMRNNQFG